MKEICLPFGGISDNDTAEVIVRSKNSGITWTYRIESFPFDKTMETEKYIEKLKQYIEHYDPAWDLIQVMDVSDHSPFVHILYRQNKKSSISINPK